MENRTEFGQIDTKPDCPKVGRVIESRTLAKKWLHFQNHHQNKRLCRTFGGRNVHQSREKLSDVLTSQSVKNTKKHKIAGLSVRHT